MFIAYIEKWTVVEHYLKILTTQRRVTDLDRLPNVYECSNLMSQLFKH